MKRIYKYLILISISLTSCEGIFLSEDIDELNKNIKAELMLGNWSNSIHQDTTIILEKVKKLPEDQYGISFMENGKLTEWKNVGFCGTPPVTYGAFEGSWELISDSVLSIDATFWGGKVSIEWGIIDITDEYLKYSLKKWDADMN